MPISRHMIENIQQADGHKLTHSVEVEAQGQAMVTAVSNQALRNATNGGTTSAANNELGGAPLNLDHHHSRWLGLPSFFGLVFFIAALFLDNDQEIEATQRCLVMGTAASNFLGLTKLADDKTTFFREHI